MNRYNESMRDEYEYIRPDEFEYEPDPDGIHIECPRCSLQSTHAEQPVYTCQACGYKTAIAGK